MVNVRRTHAKNGYAYFLYVDMIILDGDNVDIVMLTLTYDVVWKECAVDCERLQLSSHAYV